jgi:predicted Rossmann fold flavoprotein
VKVGISGGGRCNVTHACFEPARLITHYPRGGRELLGPFTRFGARATVAWFAARGVALKTEGDGRMFPATDRSQTIVDLLQAAADRAGVRLLTRVRVDHIEAPGAADRRGTFRLGGSGVPATDFERVLLATGGSAQGHRLAASMGHTIVPCVPSLFSFAVRDLRLGGLAGISFPDVELQLITPSTARLTRRGPLLITHWGLSGPAVLWLSAWGARALHESGYRAELRVNLLPDISPTDVTAALHKRRREHGTSRPHNDPLFGLPRRYWSRICEVAGIDEAATWAHLRQDAQRALADELSAARFEVSGRGEFKEEFVTCGGVDLKEVDFRTMESRRCPGLYFAGEILDIDGVTGGFNFQSAWTCGYLAGRGMAGCD